MTNKDNRTGLLTRAKEKREVRVALLSPDGEASH